MSRVSFVSETSVAWVRQAIVRQGTDTIEYRRATYARVGLLSPLYQCNVKYLCFKQHIAQIQRSYQTSDRTVVSTVTSVVSLFFVTRTQRT